MTATGWAFMIVSWVVILGTFGYCIARTIRQRPTPPDEQTPAQS